MPVPGFLDTAQMATFDRKPGFSSPLCDGHIKILTLYSDPNQNSNDNFELLLHMDNKLLWTCQGGSYFQKLFEFFYIRAYLWLLRVNKKSAKFQDPTPPGKTPTPIYFEDSYTGKIQNIAFFSKIGLI